jgi:hypothetical protein
MGRRLLMAKTKLSSSPYPSFVARIFRLQRSQIEITSSRSSESSLSPTIWFKASMLVVRALDTASDPVSTSPVFCSNVLINCSAIRYNVEDAKVITLSPESARHAGLQFRTCLVLPLLPLNSFNTDRWTGSVGACEGKTDAAEIISAFQHHCFEETERRALFTDFQGMYSIKLVITLLILPLRIKA